MEKSLSFLLALFSSGKKIFSRFLPCLIAQNWVTYPSWTNPLPNCQDSVCHDILWVNRIRVYQPESLANGCSTQFSKDLKWSEIAKTSKWGGVIAQLYRKPIRRGMSHNSSYFTQYRAHIQCYLIVWMGEWDRERLLPAQGHITVWLVEQNWESSPTWWVSRPRFFQLFYKGCFCLVPIVWPDSVH